MRGYLDASVLVPLFLEDPFTERAVAWLRTRDLTPVVSDWAALEISNVISRRLRIQALTRTQALTTLADVDLWRGRSALTAETTAADIAMAMLHVRRFEVALRGPDAVHLAIAQRLEAVLFTFDERMATAAASIGLKVA